MTSVLNDHEPANEALPPTTQDIQHTIEVFDGDDQPINIEGGDEAVEYDLPRKLLSFYSACFRQKIKEIDEKLEKTTREHIPIPAQYQRAFHHFKCWLLNPGRKMRNDGPAPDWQYFSMLELCELWVFAMKIEAPMLQNRAIDLMVSRMVSGNEVEMDAIEYMYTHPETHRDWQARRLLVAYLAPDEHLYSSNGQGGLDDGGWFGDFRREIFSSRHFGISAGSPQPMPVPWQRNAAWHRCKYHVHYEGERQCPNTSWSIID